MIKVVIECLVVSRFSDITAVDFVEVQVSDGLVGVACYYWVWLISGKPVTKATVGQLHW